MILELYSKARNKEEISDKEIRELLEIRTPDYDDNQVKALAYVLDYFCVKKFNLLNEGKYSEDEKKFAEDILMNVGFITNYLFNEQKYFHAYIIYNTMKIPFSLFNHKNLIKYLSWIEYVFDHSYILSLNNNTHESIMQCLFALDDYYRNSQNVEKRITDEEDKIRKSHSDKAMVYSYLIKMSKLGASLSVTSGLHSERSKFLFYENYINEKLLWICERFTSIELMISMRSKVITLYSNQTIVFSTGNMDRGKITFLNFKFKLKSLGLKIMRLTCGYGEKPFNLLISSAVLMIIYSFFYLMASGVHFESFPSMMFTSFKIFTSFSVPEEFLNNYIKKILFVTEIIFGIIFINGFIISLARKYLR